MKTTLVLLVVSLLAAGPGAGVASATPIVTSFDPQVVVADAPGDATPIRVNLYGTGLTLPSTNGTTFDTDVQVYATAPGHEWQQAVRTGWASISHFGSSSIEVTLLGLPAAGTLQFQVCVRTQGCMTAYTNVPIRAYSTAAPILWDPNGETYAPIKASVPPSDSSRLVTFYADNLNNGWPCMYIDGTGGGYVSIARVDPGEGWGYFYMPSLATGDHHIWISNRGCYNPRWSAFNTIHVAISWP